MSQKKVGEHSMEMEQLERQRKKTSLQSMYFNRFLGIRYAIALFFFTNLYWFVLTVGVAKLAAIIPLVLVVLLGFAGVEQVRLISQHRNQIPHAKRFFTAQLVVNLGLLTIIFTPLFRQFYPFFANTNQAKLSVSILLLAGCLLCLLIVKRIKKIEVNADVHYQRIMAYQKIVEER